MSITPSTFYPPHKDTLTTRNLFEVAALSVKGVRLHKAERVGSKVVFSFNDPRASKILDEHRNGELEVMSREFVAAINSARDIAFAL